MSTSIPILEDPIPFSCSDNQPGAIAKLQAMNSFYRNHRWPKEYSSTRHKLLCDDARNLSFLKDQSVHLVVTSPPYWILKQYAVNERQLGAIDDYDEFLAELDKVWAECARVLAPGGRICCVVGDVCIPRKRDGRHRIMPLHADIMVRARRLGLDSLTPILWFKIANGAMEARGNGAGFYGKPYQPGAIVKNDFEYILFLRKGGTYRSPSAMQKALSILSKEEMKNWLRTSWSDIKGESTRKGHPAPYPVELAERLVRLFSFAGDVVLDPFAGRGSTAVAAIYSGRNSISIDVEPEYVELAQECMSQALLLRNNSHLFDATLDLSIRKS